MSDPKNQHYVPRLYLRQFAAERRGKNPPIYSFDKETRRVRRPTIRAIASEDFFYETEDQGIERAFKQIEDLFVEPYLRLLTLERPSLLTPAEMAAVSAFVAAQLVRTREHRNEVLSLNRELTKALGSESLAPPMGEEEARQIQLNVLFNNGHEVATILAQMKWIIETNRTSMPFWTSDSPVTRYNPLPEGLMGNRGLRCRGIQVFFPLSPCRALCLCDPEYYSAMPDAIEISDVRNVWLQNDLELRSSTRFLYSSTGDFELAHQILAEYPLYGDPARSRVRVN